MKADKFWEILLGYALMCAMCRWLTGPISFEAFAGLSGFYVFAVWFLAGLYILF